MLEESTMDGPADRPVLPTATSRIDYWSNLLAVGTALVEKYAPAAPEAIANEATVRCCGYLHEHTLSAMSRLSDGNQEASFNTGALSALRHSGAQAILTFWKVRRAL